jgi:ankyrin repeat protein
MLTAASTSSVECAELLLAHGASLDDKDNNDNNALMPAALNNSPEARCTHTHTHWLAVVACGGGVKMVRWLIGKGLDVNAGNKDRETPVSLAAAGGQVENLRILIEHGAKVNRVRSDGRTPFLVAGLTGKLSTIRYLLSNGHASVAERDRSGGSVLLYACLRGSVECLEFLLSQGASLDETDKQVRTVYGGGGDLHVKRSFSSINQSINQGFTPLAYAATKGNVEVVEWLLSVKKVDVDRIVLGSRAVHCAISRGRARAVAALLDHGARLDIPSRQVAPALVQACSSGSIETVALLLARGLDLRDERGRKYVEAALHTGKAAFCH